MRPTDDCFELIQKWEGLHELQPDGSIKSYLDPVNIWTIGYGSINHQDLNRPVQPRDVISKQTAERWLRQEVKQVAEDITQLCKAPLTNGMFDALVSFVYNVGIGAFGESTLLRKLNQKNYVGAAKEFGRWVHGQDNGMRKVLPGLVNRRRDEEKLFLRDGSNSSDRTSEADPFVNVENVDSSMPEEQMDDYIPAPVPLPFSRVLQQGQIGKDCYVLNCALAGLGFLRMAPQSNHFSQVTYDAVKLFQYRESLSRIDGLVGPETKRAMENALSRARRSVRTIPEEQNVFCQLTRTSEKAYANLAWCDLAFVKPGIGVVDSIKVISGLPSSQTFLTWDDLDSTPGNNAPIPQDSYYIGDIDWASGRLDDYETAHAQAGIGPVWVPIQKQPGRPKNCGGSGCRDAFGFHADWNWIVSNSSPGSAGCVCPDTPEKLVELVRLLRRHDPRLLVVDWGL